MSGFFSEYIKLLLSVGMCAFLCEKAACFGKSKVLSSAMGLITSLCLFLTAVMPPASLFSNIGNIKREGVTEKIENVEYTESDFFTLVRGNLERELASKILHETGIEIAGVGIDLSVEENLMNIDSITVKLSGKVENTNEISRVIYENFGSETKIIFTE